MSWSCMWGVCWRMTRGMRESEGWWLRGFLLQWHHLGSDWPSFCSAHIFQIIPEETGFAESVSPTCFYIVAYTRWRQGCKMKHLNIHAESCMIVLERILISLPLLNHLPFALSSSSFSLPLFLLLHQLKWLYGFMRQPFKSLPFPHWSRQKVIGSIKRIKSLGKMEWFNSQIKKG